MKNFKYECTCNSNRTYRSYKDAVVLSEHHQREFLSSYVLQGVSLNRTISRPDPPRTQLARHRAEAARQAAAGDP